jgi:hypothetical protein
MPDGAQFLLYTDDTGFDKIVNRPTTIMALAGDGELISLWKKWWSSATPNMSDRPPVSISKERQVVLYMTSKSENKILFDVGRKLAWLEDDVVIAVFSGSGRKAAADCWIMNNCAKKAVESSKAIDLFTGGDIKFVDYQNLSDNLSAPNFDYNVIVDAINKKGLIMPINVNVTASNGSVEISGHPAANDIAEQFKSGSIIASAPTGDAGTFSWSSDKELKLDGVLSSILEEEANL